MDVMTARQTRLAQKAEEAGFTERGLYHMLLLLNLDEGTIKDMTIEQFQDLLLYVNDINSRNFNQWG